MRLPTRIVRELLTSHLLVCAFTSALFSTSTSMHSKYPLAAARDNIGRLSTSRAVTSAPCVASKQRRHSHSSATCHGVHHLCHKSTMFYQLLDFTMRSYYSLLPRLSPHMNGPGNEASHIDCVWLTVVSYPGSSPEPGYEAS